MNSKTLVKFIVGILPLAPVAGNYLGEESPKSSETESQVSEEYTGPTMEDEINNHSGNLPAIKNVENINIKNGDDFDPLAGVYAVDSTDGDLTDEIEVTENNVDTSANGTYNVSYRVENSRGGYYTYVRVITVSDNESDPIPTIPPSTNEASDETSEAQSSQVEFTGVEDLTINVGEDFEAKNGVSVTDVDGTDISNQVYISGEVDNQTPGEYTIAYAVFDIFGNPSAAARTVTVE